jgi:cobalt-zinc-cadmium efflux system membrane fusion protein
MKKQPIAKIAVGVGIGLLALLLVRTMRGTAASTSPGASASAGEGTGLRLPKKVGPESRVETAAAKKSALARDLQVVGSVDYDADHYAIVGPLISGRIVSLKAGPGALVRKGQVLAELESAEVGQAVAAYLEAKAKAGATEINLRRERDLAARHVSSEREREVAEAQASTESAILNSAKQKLEALGLKMTDIAQLETAGAAAGRVSIRSPIDGTVISRQVTLGQAVQAATDAFKVANLRHLWVNLDVYEKDLPAVTVNERAEIHAAGLGPRIFPGRVAYLESHIDEKTRTARVRIEIENSDLSLRSGQFVTAKLIGDPKQSLRQVLTVPRQAVSTVEGRTIVFVVKENDNFERRDVEIGGSGGGEIEIAKGLEEGERVATNGAFLLKSELLR